MTYKNDTITFSLMGTSIMLLAIMAVPSLVEYADASQCNPHCYATVKNSYFNNYGAKSNFTVEQLEEGGSCPNSFDMVVTPLWITFSDGKWVEIGVGEGRMNGTCKTVETFYSYDGINSNWTLHGTATRGNTYDMKIERSGSTTWKTYIDGGLKETYTSVYTQGKGSIGAETTDTLAIIADQDRDNIKRKSSSSSSAYYNWSTSNSQDGSNSNPPYKDICTSYSHIIIGDTSATQSACP